MAAALLFTTSCEHQDLTPTVGGEVTVSVNVSTPEIATRASYSDGQTANNLQYAVYHKATGKQSKTAETTISGGRQTLEFQLTAGETYEIILWADHESAPYTVSFGQAIEETTMTVDYSNVKSNDENLDAFYAVKEFTVNGTQTETVELRRPFAQLNIGTNDYDEALTASNYRPTKSSVTVSHVNNVMNLYTGDVDGDVTVEFKSNALATGDFPVDNYEYVAMNYVLVGADKSLVDVEFTISDDNGNNKTRALQLVPVQRNYRTNLYGSILTSDVDMNVVIAPGYDDEEQVTLPWATIGDKRYESFADAMNAVQNNETIKLQGVTTLNGVVDGNLFTIDGKAITIDLNGYGFVAEIPDVTKNSSIFRVAKNSTLTIIGEGNIKFITNKAENCLAAFINNDGGNVNLRSGDWVLTALNNWQESLIPTFVDNNSNVNSATLNIYGGTYTFNRNLFRNFANAAGHNGFATVATMNIYGGTFNGLENDPGAIWNQKANAAAPAGAGVINVYGGTFNNVVIDDEFAINANSNDEVAAALRNPEVSTIQLGAGEYTLDLYASEHSKESLTILGSEGTKVKFAKSQVRMDIYDQFTIHNCEILHMAEKSWGMLVFSNGKANGVYTVSNCTFNGKNTQGIYINEVNSTATYNIENCTFNGDFGGHDGAITIQTNKDVEFTVNVMGCEFNDIPDNCNRIYLAPSTQGLFYDLNLNTDLKATTAYEIETFLKLGFKTINLADGNYKMPQVDLQGKKLTLVGSKQAVIDASEINANNQFVTGATLAFEGLTLNFGKDNYMGFANTASLTYKDCAINGLQFLYGDASFEGCKFNSQAAEHSVWTYGAKNVNFTDCDFTYGDRCVNCYNDNDIPGGKQTVNFTNCKFTTANTGSRGAVEINSCFFSVGIEVNLTSCTAPAYGDMAYVSEWDSTNGAKTIINIQ